MQKPETVEDWSAEAREKLRELAGNDGTMFHFEILDSNDPVRVKLSLNGTNVSDILASVQGHELSEKSVIIDEMAIKERTVDVEDHAEPNEQSFERQQTDESFSEEITKNESSITAESVEEPVKQDNDKLVTELTVDEIIQNMERNTPEESDEPEGLRVSVSFPQGTDDQDPQGSSSEQKADEEATKEMALGIPNVEDIAEKEEDQVPSTNADDTTISTAQQSANGGLDEPRELIELTEGKLSETKGTISPEHEDPVKSSETKTDPCGIQSGESGDSNESMEKETNEETKANPSPSTMTETAGTETADASDANSLKISTEQVLNTSEMPVSNSQEDQKG